MGFFGKISNPITHGQDLKDRIRMIEEYKSFLEEKDQEMRDGISQLYESRKEALRQVQDLNVYVKTLPHHPIVLEEGCARAIEFMGSIEQAASWEAQFTDFSSGETKKRGGGFAAAGAIAGGLTAAWGPTAAMAFATTFGTASTGAAISTLGGAAATNAALAWLGGGAVAAGGGGMAAGSAILAALGPIGLGIGAIGIFGGGFLIRRQNNKKIQELDKLIADLNIPQNRDDITAKMHWIDTLLCKTREILAQMRKSTLPVQAADYNDASFPRKQLFTLVDDAKLLGKMSQESLIMGKHV